MTHSPMWWPQLREAAERVLPGMRSARDWLPEVVRPAFERCEQVIYEREAQR